MYLVDANILIYSADQSSEFHDKSREWLLSCIKSKTTVCLSWIVILAFIRITTNQRIMSNPFTLKEAFSYIKQLLLQTNFELVDAQIDLLENFELTAVSGQAKGAIIMDAYLATLAIERNLTLCSQDKDFMRFDNLKLLNPLSL
jgi:uncharacterized protein